MFSRRVVKKWLAAAAAIMMAFVMIMPAAAEKAPRGQVSIKVMEDFGSPGNVSVVKMIQDGRGNLFILGNSKVQMGETDNNTYQRMFVTKYAMTDLSTPLATAVIVGSTSSEEYYSGDTSSTYNGAMTCDADGNVYVAGTHKVSGVKSIVLYKLSNDLEQLGSMTAASYSNSSSGTYYDPMVHGLAVDESGNVFIGGDTPLDFGFDNPVYPSSTFDTLSTSARQGFILKVNSALSAVQAATYMGGKNGRVMDLVYDNSVLYAAGIDNSGAVPTSEGVLQSEKNAANSADAFILKMDSDLQTTAGTYYGGSKAEEVTALRVRNGLVYLAGDTSSQDMLLSEDAFQTVNTSGGNSYPTAFIVKMDTSLKKTDDFAATLCGGGSREDAFDIDIDASGKIYLTGQSRSGSTFPSTDGTQTGYIFAAGFTADLTSMTVGTLIGESQSYEYGRGIIVSGDSVYLTGTRGSSTSNTRAFIAKYGTTMAHAKVTNVRTNPTGSSYNKQYFGKGAEIAIKVTFDAAVTVTGEPSLKLNITNNGENQEAVYQSGSGSKELIFTYTVKEGDTTDGAVLNVVDKDSLLLNGGTIEPKAGAAPDDTNLTLPTDKMNGDYAYVKAVPSKVKSVSASLEGTFGPGTVIPITVTLDETIKSVTGKPEIEMNSGGKAVFKEIVQTGSYSPTNTDQMIFEYTVGENDTSAKLDYTDTDALVIPEGASIKDLYDSEIDPTLPEPGEEGSISKERTIVIDKDAVTVEKVEFPESLQGKTYKAGSELTINMTFSEPVTTTGRMQLALALSGDYDTKAVAEAVENQKTVAFTYTIQAGNALKDGYDYLDYDSVSALTLESGAAISAGEKAVSLYLAEPGTENSLSSGRVSVDTVAPRNNTSSANLYKGKTATSSTKYFKAGDEMFLKIAVSEPVTVKEGANPYILMNFKSVGSDENARWSYDSVDDRYLYFKYVVVDGDSMINGDLYSASTWKIFAEEGDITDEAGNSMSETLTAPSSWLSGLKGVYIDTVNPVFNEETEFKAEIAEDLKNVVLTMPTASDEGSGMSTSSPYPYTLYRQEKGSGDDPVQITTFSNDTNLNRGYTDSSVSPETTYIYTLKAVDKCGNQAVITSNEITTYDASGNPPDLEPPYWDEDKELTFEWTGESTGKLSWDKGKAQDKVSGVNGFVVYQWNEEEQSWIKLGETDKNTDTYEVTNLALEKEYQFKVEAVDAKEALESTDGPQVTAPAQYALVTVVDQDGKVLKNLLESDVEEMEWSQQRMSSVNSVGSRAYYAAEGLYLEDLLQMAGVQKYAGALIVTATDGTQGAISKAMITGNGYYYYAPNYDNVNVKAVPVKAMLVFSYTESENAEPDYGTGGTKLPRIFFGQRSINDVNRSGFISSVSRIQVRVSDELVTFEENEAVRQEDGDIASVTALEDGKTTLTAHVSASKAEADNPAFTFVQMRGKKMVDIVTFADKGKTDYDVSAEFDLQEDDQVIAYLTDNMDAAADSSAQIINEQASNATPVIEADDIIMDHEQDVIEIAGTAQADLITSVKVVDSEGAIRYFAGVMADPNGAFKVEADLSDAAYPLTAVITSGKSVKAVKIEIDKSELLEAYQEAKEAADQAGAAAAEKQQTADETLAQAEELLAQADEKLQAAADAGGTAAVKAAEEAQEAVEAAAAAVQTALDAANEAAAAAQAYTDAAATLSEAAQNLDEAEQLAEAQSIAADAAMRQTAATQTLSEAEDDGQEAAEKELLAQALAEAAENKADEASDERFRSVVELAELDSLIDRDLYVKSTLDDYEAAYTAFKETVKDENASAEAIAEARHNVINTYLALLEKDEQPLQISTDEASSNYAKTVKAAQAFDLVTASNNTGSLTFKKASGASYVAVNASTGQIVLKKGTPAGTYTVGITVTAAATDTLKEAVQTVSVTIKVQKAAQKMSVKAAKKTVSAAKVKKAKQTVKALTVKGAQGKKKFTRTGGSKKLSVNAKTGKITVAKGTKKGTYTVKVKVSASGGKNYKAASKTVSVKVTVK